MRYIHSYCIFAIKIKLKKISSCSKPRRQGRDGAREEGGKGKGVMVDSTEINIVQKA